MFLDQFLVNLVFSKGIINTGQIKINYDKERKIIGIQYLFPNEKLSQMGIRNQLDEKKVGYTWTNFRRCIVLGLGSSVMLGILDHYISQENSDIGEFHIVNSSHDYSRSNLYHLKKVGFDSSSFFNRIACRLNLIKGEQFGSCYKKLAEYVNPQRIKDGFQKFSVKIKE